MPIEYSTAPERWGDAVAHSETTLHQMSPYIGKLKSSIAKSLIETYSVPGDVIFDPFCGSGTIPFEALCLKRRTIAADCNPYALVLTRAKISAPKSLEIAKRRAHAMLNLSEASQSPDLRSIPIWVRRFFHPQTLKEVLAFRDQAVKSGDDFLLAALLGILHHQRPGFLSYPSSHLVPYLRSKLFPRDQFPELYEYRELESRLMRKLDRLYKRPHAKFRVADARVIESPIQNLNLRSKFDCLITSPPYMNALDYGRDNRLRLWLSTRRDVDQSLDLQTRFAHRFADLLVSLGMTAHRGLKRGGFCVLVVGELSNQSLAKLVTLLHDSFLVAASDLQLMEVISDEIPDVRRSRRDDRGVKKEHAFVFKRIG